MNQLTHTLDERLCSIKQHFYIGFDRIMTVISLKPKISKIVQKSSIFGCAIAL